MKIESYEGTSQPGSYGARVAGAILQLPSDLAEIFEPFADDVEDLLDFINNYPTATATRLGWSVEQAQAATSELMSLLTEEAFEFTESYIANGMGGPPHHIPMGALSPHETININDLKTGDRILISTRYWPDEEKDAIVFIVLEVKAGGMGHLDIGGIAERDGGPDEVLISRSHDPRDEFVLIESMGALTIKMPDHSQWEVPLAYIARYQNKHHPDADWGDTWTQYIHPYELYHYALDHMDWGSLSLVAVQVEKPDPAALYNESWPTKVECEV